MAQKVSKPAKTTGGGDEIQRVVADNRRARHEYEIMESLECGLALRGTEVKSLRHGKVSLDESYARVEGDEVWLVNCDIPEYRQGGMWNHEPKRLRKLLMHRSEVRKFAAKSKEKGLTLVPLRLYFTQRGIAKLLLGLCRGKQLHDKRDSIKKREVKREIDRQMRRH
jgi:SsrA-binding protein